jgi:hypothetical protein
MKLKTLSAMLVLLVFSMIVLMPRQANAIPAFARKYGVKCYTCHTVPPALNKNGYMFKRLGYRMPTDEMDGTKPAPKIIEMDKDMKFSIINSMALILQASVTNEKTVADKGNTTSASPATSCGSSTSSSSSCSSFNLDEAALFMAGPIPETGFSYFAHYELYQGGSNNLEQGFRRLDGRQSQQQLLRQGRRDAYAGGRGNAGGDVLQSLRRPRLYPH